MGFPRDDYNDLREECYLRNSHECRDKVVTPDDVMCGFIDRANKRLTTVVRLYPIII